MSKRKLFLYCLLIGVIVYAIPLFTGQYIQSKYNDFVSRVSEFEGTQLTSISYERKWRKSIAKTEVTFTKARISQLLAAWQQPTDGAFKKFPDLDFVLEHEIHHGPLVKVSSEQGWKFTRAAIISKLSLTEEARKAIEAEVGTSELIRLESEMDLLDGDITILMNGDSFRTNEQEKSEPPAWGGIKGVWQFNSALDQFRARVIIPGFNVDIYDAKYKARDLLFETHRKRLKEGRWEGKGNMKVQQFAVDDPDDSLMLNAESIMVSGLVRQKDNLMNSSGSLSTQIFDYNDARVGPLNFNASVRNIPEDIFYLIRELARTAPSPGQIPEYIMASPEFLTSLPRLLEFKPEIILDRIFMKTPEGVLSGQANLTLGGPNANSNMSSVVNSIVASADFSFPKAIFKRVMTASMQEQLRTEGVEIQRLEADAQGRYQDKIATWIGGGYLIDKGDTYEFKLEFLKGKLKINGVYRDLPAN